MGGSAKCVVRMFALVVNTHIYTHIYTHARTHTHIHTYTQRERERERETTHLPPQSARVVDEDVNAAKPACVCARVCECAGIPIGV